MSFLHSLPGLAQTLIDRDLCASPGRKISLTKGAGRLLHHEVFKKREASLANSILVPLMRRSLDGNGSRKLSTAEAPEPYTQSFL